MGWWKDLTGQDDSGDAPNPLGTFVSDIVKTGTDVVQGAVSGVADPLVKGISRGADDLATSLNINNTNKFLNAYVNFASGGTFGVDTSGNAIPINDIGRAVDEFVGEISGRNQQRENAGRQAEIDAARAAQQAEIAAENKRKEQVDIAASKAGGITRQAALGNYGVYGGGSAVNPLVNPSKDFMGL